MLDHSCKPFILYPHIYSILMFMCADNVSNEFNFLILLYLGAIAAFQSRSCSTSFLNSALLLSLESYYYHVSPPFIYTPFSCFVWTFLNSKSSGTFMAVLVVQTMDPSELVPLWVAR